jgi:hypothetical protein
MIPLGIALRRISAGLQRASVSFALVGDLAVSVRVEPRFTRDIDLAVAVASDVEAEALVRALANEGWRVSAVVEQEAVGSSCSPGRRRDLKTRLIWLLCLTSPTAGIWRLLAVLRSSLRNVGITAVGTLSPNLNRLLTDRQRRARWAQLVPYGLERILEES